MSHPLIDPTTAPAIAPDGSHVSYESGHVVVDATPIYLFGIVLGSVALLAGLKMAGFRFVIGVGQ